MKPQSFKNAKRSEPRSFKKRSDKNQGEEKAQLNAINDLVQLLQDSNKTLTLRELKAAHPELKEFLLKKKFEHFDDDDDKKLDASEMSKMFKFTPTEEVLKFTEKLRKIIGAFNEAVEKLVKLLDVDGNSGLCVEELKIAYPDSGLAEFLMEYYDTDNDAVTTLDAKEMSKMFLNWKGEYQTEEVVNFTKKLEEKRFDEAAKEFVTVLDENNNEKIDVKELCLAYPQFGTDLGEFLSRYDSNGDGELDANEVKKIFVNEDAIYLDEILEMINDLKLKKNPNLWANVIEEPESD